MKSKAERKADVLDELDAISKLFIREGAQQLDGAGGMRKALPVVEAGVAVAQLAAALRGE